MNTIACGNAMEKLLGGGAARTVVCLASSALIAAALAGCSGSTSGSGDGGGNASGSGSSAQAAQSSTSAAEVDKSGLRTAYDAVAALENDGYTAETWEALQVAMLDAAAVLEDDDATPAEVDAAQSALASAASALAVEFKPENYEFADYESVARTPDEWKGKKVAFTGRVLQVSEGNSENQIRLATNGKYDDVVMVGYDPGIVSGRILEDDNITVYGSCVGLYSYTSTMGKKITLPGVYADQVVLN